MGDLRITLDFFEDVSQIILFKPKLTYILSASSHLLGLHTQWLPTYEAIAV